MGHTAPDPTRSHPDPIVESFLTILGRTAQALARVGATDHARERFRQAITVGTLLGCPQPLVGRSVAGHDAAPRATRPTPVARSARGGGGQKR